MDRVEDLNKASSVLLDMKIRLQTVQTHRMQIDKEIAILNMFEANLEENIRVLKNKRYIVAAMEFKKASNDLTTARVRKSFLRIDRENCLKIERHAEIMYDRAKAEYERLFELIHNPPNNVIQVDFTRKKNGK